MLTHEQFTYLAQKYIDTVFRACYSYLRSRSEAEDVVQNTFLKLLTTAKVFHSEEHIKHWLIRVAINECKRTLLSPWRKAVPIEDCAAEVGCVTPEHSEIFYAAMALPQKYRIVLFLHYYEDYSVEDISTALGCPANTVKTRLRRGRELLKKSLREAEEI